MNINEYTSKYSMLFGGNFNRDEFLIDLNVDLLDMFYRNNGSVTLSKFKETIIFLKYKYDLIIKSLLIVEDITDTYWNEFTSSYINPLKYNHFPEEEVKDQAKYKTKEKTRKKRTYKKRDKKKSSGWEDQWKQWSSQNNNYKSTKTTTSYKSPLQILGLKSGATKKEITKAYRKLSMVHHPDMSTGDQVEFVKLTEAKDKAMLLAY